MIQANQIRGAIFDVDDTLIRTVNVDRPTHSLHELARLAAIHEAGRQFNLAPLLAVTHEQNLNAFLESPIHTGEGAVWAILEQTSLVEAGAINAEHWLLRHIVARKDALYSPVLRQEGKEIPGAVKFIASLGQLGLHDRLAIASSGGRPDIMTILELLGLQHYFPNERIISKESVINHKPHPEPFDLAFRSLKLPDDHRTYVLAVEDAPKGVASAKGAGLFACALTTWQSAAEFQAAAIRPDLIAGSYQELAALLGIEAALRQLAPPPTT